MSNWEVIDDGSWNGVRKSIRSNPHDPDAIEVRHEDVGSRQIIEENKRADTHKIGKDIWHVGRIPGWILHEWYTEEGLDVYSSDPDMRKRVMKKLMDGDWRDLVPGGAKLRL
jgi:hypothetical protein